MKSEMLEFASDAAEHAIRSSTVGIVSGSGDEKWNGIGTGTLVRWKGRHLILTAAHVIADTLREDLRFIFPADSPPNKVDRDTLLTIPGAPTALMHPPVEIEFGQLIADPSPGLDLAAIGVDGRIEGQYPVRFFDLVPGGRTPTEGQQTIVIGFPRDIARRTHKGTLVVFTSVDWTRVEQNRTYLQGFDPDTHFLASYTQAETYPEAKPHGISGAGMWFLGNEKLSVWYPKLDIAGVGVNWYPHACLLKMVRREAVEEFLTASVA